MNATLMNAELNKFDESTCERICRNCAVAFKLPALAFYETDGYVEIVYKLWSIAVQDKNYYQVWHSLLRQMLMKLDVYRCLVEHAQEMKDFSPSIEQALINIDLNASESMKDEVT